MTTYTGGCACGAVRYGTSADPVAQLHCQCGHCRKRSGSGHSSYLVFAAPGAVTREGAESTWSVAGDSGRMKDHHFCPTCGVPTSLTFPHSPDLVAIHAGSLDDPEAFAPSLVTYAGSAVDWDGVDPGLTRFDKGPQ